MEGAEQGRQAVRGNGKRDRESRAGEMTRKALRTHLSDARWQEETYRMVKLNS